MNEPKVAGTSPCQVDLEAGKKYAFCTCGLSEAQPFCDGRHKGTGFTPTVFQADESKTAFFCACKKTANAPNCDGSNNQLKDS